MKTISVEHLPYYILKSPIALSIIAFFDNRSFSEGCSEGWPIIHNTLLRMEHIGKILITVGVILIIAGVIIYFAGDKLSWLGHLPGDINIRKENVRIFIPITTMILISAVLSLLLYLIRKLF